jgi:hypothetical protein
MKIFTTLIASATLTPMAISAPLHNEMRFDEVSTSPIFVIALIHAIPIIWIAYWLKSRTHVIIATTLMTFVAIFLGSPKYIAFDLLAVGAGCWAGMTMIKKR